MQASETFVDVSERKSYYLHIGGVVARMLLWSSSSLVSFRPVMLKKLHIYNSDAIALSDFERQCRKRIAVDMAAAISHAEFVHSYLEFGNRSAAKKQLP